MVQLTKLKCQPQPGSQNMLEVYIDGSQTPNRSGYACHWPTRSDLDLAEKLPDGTSCARAEVYAMFRCLQQCLAVAEQQVTCYCDNIYVVKGVNEWMKGWHRKGWVRAKNEKVAHQDLWEQIFAMWTTLDRQGRAPIIVHVNSHRGIPGNERADQMAKGQFNS